MAGKIAAAVASDLMSVSEAFALEILLCDERVDNVFALTDVVDFLLRGDERGSTSDGEEAASGSGERVAERESTDSMASQWIVASLESEV